MRIKLLILLVLAALASGTGAWAVTAQQAARASTCCGFCEPGEPCCGFCR